jgi:O-antigen ligase
MVVAMEYAKTKSDVYRFVVLLMIWSVVLSSLEYFSLFSHAGFSLNVMKSFVFQDKNIIATTWGKSNYLAAFWVVLIPFAMSIFGGLRSTWRWGVLVVIGLMFTALLITFSRGGLLGTLVGIMLVISRYLKPKMIFTFLAIITILFLAILINPTIFSLIEELLKLDKSASVMSRVDFWKDTWRIFLNHPFWGVGLGNLGYYSTYASNAKLSAHNIILGLMAEAGIAGCVFFSILIMRVLKKLVNSYKIVLDEFGRNMLWGITSAMVGAIVHSMFEPTFEGIEFSIFIWTIVGVAFKVPLIF